MTRGSCYAGFIEGKGPSLIKGKKMAASIHGGNIYKFSYSNGKSVEVEAFNQEGAEWIVNNMCLTYSWGKFTLKGSE